MNQTAPVVRLVKILSWLAAVIMVALPFHAFVTVWLASLIGHYTLLRLWKEFLLLPLVVGALYLLAIKAELRRQFLSLWLVRLIAVYFGLLLTCALVPLVRHTVSAKAVWYGLLVDSRFLVLFLAIWVIAASSSWLSRRWRQILIGPAILVTAFAVLQYWVLPFDFLRHFGYSQATIYPYETINHNLHHIRVASTLRGANPLGAYLLLPISVLGVSLFKDKSGRRDQLLLGAGLLLALIFSFSRSAWIGAALVVLTIAGLVIKKQRTRKIFELSLVGVLVVAAAAGLLLRNNLSFENAVLHTDRVSKAAQSSNQGHTAAAKAAVKDIYHQPLGGGVGSAGPQSVYNKRPSRIAENYYLQIGQEAGVIGMVLFIAICAAAGQQLYRRRNDPLALALLAALVGLSFVNLLSHAWSDDTLAYVFWGMAGIALAPKLAKGKNT